MIMTFLHRFIFYNYELFFCAFEAVTCWIRLSIKLKSESIKPEFSCDLAHVIVTVALSTSKGNDVICAEEVQLSKWDFNEKIGQSRGIRFLLLRPV